MDPRLFGTDPDPDPQHCYKATCNQFYLFSIPKCSYVNVLVLELFLFIYLLLLKSRSGRVKMLSKIKVRESLSPFRLTQSSYFTKLQETSFSGRKKHFLTLSSFICSLLLLLAVWGTILLCIGSDRLGVYAGGAQLGRE